MTLANIIADLCPNLANGTDYTVIDRGDGSGPQVIWTSGTPDPRATTQAIAVLASTPDPKTASQTLQASLALFVAQPAAVQAALGFLASPVFMFLQNNNAAAAKDFIAASQNPTGSPLTGAQFTALQTALLACF